MTEIILFCLGIVIGGMNAIAGGGMLLGFPALVALGVPPLTANVTSGVITAPGQLASAWGYRNYLRKVPKRFIILGIPLAIGSFIGAYVLTHTNPDHFEQIVPWLVMFGVALFALQPQLHFHLRQNLRGKHRTLYPLLLISAAMLPVAFYGGYFGAGFGFMMLAFLSFAHLHDTHMMNAMKNVGAVVVSVAALLCLYPTGLIDWRIGVITGAGAVVGGYCGAHFGQRLSSHWLRILVIGIGFTAVIYLALQGL